MTTVFKKIYFLGTNVEADWLDAVVVAVNFLKVETEGHKVNQKKNVLLSDLGSACNSENLDIIMKAVQSENVEICFL